MEDKMEEKTKDGLVRLWTEAVPNCGTATYNVYYENKRKNISTCLGQVTANENSARLIDDGNFVRVRETYYIDESIREHEEYDINPLTEKIR